ncbi:MAG: hypothetical protein IJV98_02765 [Clostridia bacterium]|nr:hypothetical protein [Clostridia bacterium]
MLFSFLRMLLWVMLMVAVVISSVVLNKLKIVQKHKILKFIPVILVLILFFVPFEEMLTFSSPDTAFSGTTVGTPLATAAHEESYGFFYKDRRGSYSVVFFSETDGRYKKYAEDEIAQIQLGEANGATVELFRMADTGERYLLIWAPSDTLTVEDSLGTAFAVGRSGSDAHPVSFTLAAIAPDADYALTVGGVAVDVSAVTE